MAEWAHECPFTLTRSYVASALPCPESIEQMPWGHSALKVRKKTFVFLNLEDELSLSVKLPVSRDSR